MTHVCLKHIWIEMTMLLQLSNIESGYGKKQILFDVTIGIQKEEMVAIIGPNGAGKSTILKVGCGLVPAWQGKIDFNGKNINGSTPNRNVDRGIVYCPQGKRVFNEMTVYENLQIGGLRLPKADFQSRLEELLCLFPAMKKKFRQNAGTLSGGEQQQVTIARSLLLQPKLLLLDEPSLGLSPGMVKATLEKLVEINREKHVTMMIVEQKVKDTLPFVNRVYSIKLGKIAYEGVPNRLLEDRERLKDLFL